MKAAAHSLADRSFRYGDQLIRYHVRIRPGRRAGRVAIHVEPDGRVIVDAPCGASDTALRDAVKARARWIHRHQTSIGNRLRHVLPREYVSGESHLYLGRRYRLKVSVKCCSKAAGGPTTAVRMRGGYIDVSVPRRNPMLVRTALQDWYRKRARDYLGKRLGAVAASVRWLRTAPWLRLQFMKRQWGSCSPGGGLTINPHLIKAPRECIDYVLLHEICHLKEHNHSKQFYRLMSARMPDWPQVKNRLDEMAETILNV